MKSLFWIVVLFLACVLIPVSGFFLPELWDDLTYRRPFVNARLPKAMSFVNEDGTCFVLPEGTVVESLSRMELWGGSYPDDDRRVKVYLRIQSGDWSAVVSNRSSTCYIYGQKGPDGNGAKTYP